MTKVSQAVCYHLEYHKTKPCLQSYIHETEIFIVKIEI